MGNKRNKERRQAKIQAGKGQKRGPKPGKKLKRAISGKRIETTERGDRLNFTNKKPTLTIKSTCYNKYDKINHREKLKNRKLSDWQKLFLDVNVIENRWYASNTRNLRPEIRNRIKSSLI